MSKWILKCEECGNLWTLDVSFNLREVEKLYHYCSNCRKNTFHTVLGVSEEGD